MKTGAIGLTRASFLGTRNSSFGEHKLRMHFCPGSIGLMAPAAGPKKRNEEEIRKKEKKEKKEKKKKEKKEKKKKWTRWGSRRGT